MRLDFRQWFEAAVQEVPYLDGMTFSQAVETLTDTGFQLIKTTPDGYQHFRHPDGSEIKIRPDGNIKRIGPKMDSDDPRKPGRFQPKYLASPGEEGKAILQRHTFYPGGAKSHGVTISHDSGEKVVMGF